MFSNIKKLFFLRNKKVKKTFIKPLIIFIITYLILFLFVIIGAKMNKIVSEANGGKMPVYDSSYYEGMYDDDPKHQNADNNTKLPWLADWIIFDLDSQVKIFIGRIIGATRFDKKGMPVSTYFLSPGDIIMDMSHNLSKISFYLFLFWYVLIFILFILGKNYIFEEI